MAAKTAYVVARVEPEVKEQAEEILSQLGIPASVAINMLYKQIIITHSIPFSLSASRRPLTREDMNDEAFNAMMKNGLDEAKAGVSRPAADVFDMLRTEI